MATSTNFDGGRPPGLTMLQMVPTVAQGLSRGTGARVLGMLISDKHIKNNVVQNVLKEAWRRFRPVRVSEVTETMLMFNFESVKDRDQVLEPSPWSVHSHGLNLKLCPAHMPVADVDFGRLQIWVQIYGLSLEMFNDQNANCIAYSMGRCIRIEDTHVMQQRTFLRLQVDIDIAEPLMSGFKWVDSRGQEKWASIKYERLSDFCYGCGRISHTSNSCNEQVVTDEVHGSPLYGPWITGARPRMASCWVNAGGCSRPLVSKEPGRRSWRELMLEKQNSEVPGPKSNVNMQEDQPHS